LDGWKSARNKLLPCFGRLQLPAVAMEVAGRARVRQAGRRMADACRSGPLRNASEIRFSLHQIGISELFVYLSGGRRRSSSFQSK
jgi:hypothetical protein